VLIDFPNAHTVTSSAVVKHGSIMDIMQKFNTATGLYVQNVFSFSFHSTAHTKAHLGLGQVVRVPAHLA
jgi:hypothetical protein